MHLLARSLIYVWMDLERSRSTNLRNVLIKRLYPYPHRIIRNINCEPLCEPLYELALLTL